MTCSLGDSTWTSIGTAPFVLVPVGSTEQHGPHLPLDTDTTIAVAVAEAAASRLDGSVLVAPPVSYGSSGEHQSFSGTSSIGNDVLRILLIELVRSMSTWAGRIVFVNAHGGNTSALAGAVARMIDEGHDVAWVPCATESVDLHAGLTETSLMLHIRPGSVLLDRAEVGDLRPLEEILPLMRAGGVGAVSGNGVLGDPRGASAGHGAVLLAGIVDDVVDRIAHGSADRHGLLLARSVLASP